MSTAPRRPGPASTLAEVKALLIVAALDLLRERGIDAGVTHIPLSDTIARAGVTRSTAYRSLADDDDSPQAMLHREILLHLLTRYTRGDALNTITAEVGQELERHKEALESGDVKSRSVALRSVIRVGANSNYSDAIQSPERSILTAIYGSLQSSTEADWRHGAVAEGERGLTEMFTELYSGLADLFHYRIKSPFTMEQFTAAGGSLIEGVAMRHGFNEFVTMTDRPTGVDGAMEPWTLFAIAFEAMFLGMFEPKTPEDPFADLLAY